MKLKLLFKKVGMTSFFDKNHVKLSVTLLYLCDVVVIDLKVKEKHGYNAVVLGYNFVNAQKLSKSLLNFYIQRNLKPMSKIKESRILNICTLCKVGMKYNVDHYYVGQFVNINARSKGKGYAGVMKRWNFAGLRATHGVSLTHRSGGSTGQRQDPGKVFKNKKMAGRLGCDNVTIKNMMIVDVDVLRRVIVLKGSVPGANGSDVYVQGV